MSEVSYKEISSQRGSWRIKVYIDDTWTGDIKLVEGGFKYFPRGSRKGFAGELFRSVSEVQRSLESDDEQRTGG